MTKYFFIILFVFVGCTPVNWVTTLKKIPREHSENYSVEGVKASKSEVHKQAWVVYSDRADNVAYINPGGKIKSADVNFLDAFLVIKRKGNYVQLIKHKPENEKNNKLVERKKAEYIGWMPLSRLIISPSTVTDVRSGEKDKLLTVIADTAVLFHPKRYFINADSLKVYSTPALDKPIGGTGLNYIVYRVKSSFDGRSVLVSKTTTIEPDKISEQIVGWIPIEILQNIGRKVFALTSLAEDTPQPQVLKYSPVQRARNFDTVTIFQSGVFRPIIDKTKNRVVNVDGKAITYSQRKVILKNLKQVNIWFSIESAPHLIEIYPMFLNVIQNLRLQFSDPSLNCQFGAAVAIGDSLKTFSLTTDYERMAEYLISLTDLINKPSNTIVTAWSALRGTLAQINEQQLATNIIIEIGETGDAKEEIAPKDIIESLQQKNCRLLGWQMYAKKEDNRYNNYVLQLSDMIAKYADYQITHKREIILYANQLRHSNTFREFGINSYMLDYPLSTMSQGLFMFPEKEQFLPLELLPNAVDTLFVQIKKDIELLSKNLDRAFTTVGNTKDVYDSTLIVHYHLSPESKPKKEFVEMFDNKVPLWYMPINKHIMADSLMQYRLMLSKSEVEQVKKKIETLCLIEVDIKDINKPKKGKIRQLCRYLEQTEDLTEEEMAILRTKIETFKDTVYVSTRKIRKHLKNFYLSNLSTCSVCRKKNREYQRYPLVEAHRQIFGIPSTNNGMLPKITVRDLSNKKKFSDAQLDALINYFKKQKEQFEKKFKEEQCVSGDQEYFYINNVILP